MPRSSRRNRLWSHALALLLALPGLAHAGGTPNALTLQAAEQAAERHPRIQAREQHAQALAEIPAQVASLPDPKLNLNLLNLPISKPSLSREGMTQTQLGISQALPYPGKLSLRAKSAEFVAEAAAYDVEEARIRLRRDVRLHWWSLLYLDHALRIVARNQVLLRQLVRIADSKYKTGQGLQSDVLLAQLELSKLLDAEIALQGARRDQQAALNTLMGREADAPIVLPKHVPESLPSPPALDELQHQALDARPWLHAQQRRIDAAKARVELAEKDYYPDFSIGANYGMRAGRSDLTGVMFSMSLPIFTDSKQDRALAQRQAEEARATFQWEDRRLQIERDLAQAHSDYRAAKRQALLFKSGIIPQATQTVASMLASYQVGKVDFLNLVRSQITQYNYETQYWRALASAWQAWARLEAAVGRDFTPATTQTNRSASSGNSSASKDASHE